MKNKIKILIISFGLFFFNAKAQYQDLGGWYSIGATLKLNTKWNIGLNEELRFNSNALKLDKHLTDLQIRFKHKKWIKYGLGTRYYFEKTKDNYWDKALRINLDVLLKFKHEKFTFLNRIRLQSSLNPKNTVGRLHSDEALLREKITVKYNLKKYNVKPFFSGEIFLEDYFVFSESKGDQKPKMKLETNKFRVKIGLDWTINKRNGITFSYGYQQELHQVFNQRDFLISVGYVYKFKKKKNEEK